MRLLGFIPRQVMRLAITAVFELLFGWLLRRLVGRTAGL